MRLCAPFEHQYLAVRGTDERVFVCGDDAPDPVEGDYPSFYHWALVQTAITAYNL